MKDEIVDEHEIKDKPIGAAEADFETVLVDGFLGFGLSMGNAALVLIMVLVHAPSVVESNIVAMCVAMLTCLLLFIGLKLTDAFQRAVGRKIILVSYMVSFLGAAACLILRLPYLSVALASLGTVAASFLYGRYLASLTRNALMFVVDSIFIYVGIMAFVISQAESLLSSALLGTLCVVSTIVSAAFTKKDHPYADFVSAEDSKRRSIKLKGNNHTLLLIGFMLSAVLIAFSLDFPKEIITLAIGLSIGAAGLLSLLTRQLDERVYKEWLKKSMAFSAALLLLPFSVVPEVVCLGLICLYTCFVCLNIIVLVNAIVETTRFDMISPIWLFGKHGSTYFGGIAIGSAVCALGALAGSYVDPQIALYGSIVVVIVFCSWMQISVNYQIYPFEPAIEENEDEETSVQIEQEGKRKLVWQRKIETACDRYKLSPREREVLRILLKGRDAKYIMDQFYISQSTAKTHIYNIYRKFGIHSRQDLYDFIEDIELAEDE